MSKMKPSKGMLAAILLMIAAFVLLAIFGAGSGIKGVRNMRFGIDIRGGVEAVFEPQNLDRNATKEELDIARTVIEQRLDDQNITDREVTVDQKSGYIIVRFPWKSDETSFNPEDAIAELGEMAQLTFRAPDGTVKVEGKNVKKAEVKRDTSTAIEQYVVALTFDAKGANLFREATGELVGQKMGIYMDETMISEPQVKMEISGGQATIDGMSGYDEAKALADKINAGSLPFSLATTSFSTISPTLGSNALNIMVIAGVIAFVLICLFMSIHYKLSGVVASVVLLLQMVLQMLAISIPQFTLTLPGIAGIILTLGMSVDANIIISERIAEELAEGRSVRSSIKRGYKCAFSSLLDGNVTTAIVAVILMIFGSGSMLSFGYTLLIGMIVNLLVGVTVSKAMSLSLVEFPKLCNEKYFYVKKKQKVYRIFEKRKLCLIITAIIMLTGIIGIIKNGIALDTQFTGGVVLTYKVSGDINSEEVEKNVEKMIDRPVTVQTTKSNTGDEKNLMVTLAGNGGISPEAQKEITREVEAVAGEIQVDLAETYAVEPYIGAKALKNAGIAIVLAFASILIYVKIRFSVISGLAASVTAIIALIHDVIVVFFSFVIFKIPLNDAFVAVLLTIIGYSINDTIVIYDRIRENRKNNKKLSIIELVNESISQVLARSVNSSVTTGLCVLIILVASVIFQIGSIYEFSLPMFFGVVSGCYSTIFIASTLWAMCENHKSK